MDVNLRNELLLLLLTSAVSEIVIEISPNVFFARVLLKRQSCFVANFDGWPNIPESSLTKIQHSVENLEL